MCDIPPYKKYLIEKKLDREKRVIDLILDPSFGRPQENMEVTELMGTYKNAFTVRESDGQEGTFYYFYGPSSVRNFCKYMLKVDKVFSSGEVQQLGSLLGYMTADGLDYVPGEIMPNGGVGGPNCRHEWRKFRGKFLLQPAPTENQIRTLVGKSVFE